MDLVIADVPMDDSPRGFPEPSHKETLRVLCFEAGIARAKCNEVCESVKTETSETTLAFVEDRTLLRSRELDMGNPG